MGYFLRFFLSVLGTIPFYLYVKDNSFSLKKNYGIFGVLFTFQNKLFSFYKKKKESKYSTQQERLRKYKNIDQIKKYIYDDKTKVPIVSNFLQ